MISAAPAVRLRGLCKRFGEVQAVHDVHLDLFEGEIHGLLGENGAGKSTLMSLLAGLHRPDRGTIEIFGRPVSLRSPRDAMGARVGMVHQHFMLVPNLTVAENVLLGAARIPALLRPRRLQREVSRTAGELGLAVQAEAPVKTLSLGEQQRVEILRVLGRGARVMILDEPTAVLSPAETDALFESIRQLAARGSTVVLISHKLQELRQVATRLTVMRKGQVAARLDDPAAASDEELAAAMVGRKVSLDLVRPPARPGLPLLQVRDLQVRSDRGLMAVRGVELELRAAEILGLAGVAGNGQVELVEALAGLRCPSGGSLLLQGRDMTRATPQERARCGLRYIPEDRTHTGTAPSLSVMENLLLRCYGRPPARRGLWLDLRAMASWCQEQVESLQIDTTGLDQSVRLLSGGNLQKVVLARELSEEAQVILAMHPTRGLDAWATTEVRRRLLAARSRQAAILLCSEDLDELFALSDRLVVMTDGRLVGMLGREEMDRTLVGQLMTGGVAPRAARFDAEQEGGGHES